MKKLYYSPYSEDVEEYAYQYIINKLRTNEKYKVLYLTPTMFLFRRREKRLHYLFRKYCHNNQALERFDLIKQAIHIREFDQWTKELVYQLKKASPLSRTESNVLILRAIEEAMPQRPEWLSVSGELLDLFEEFDTSMVATERLSSVSSYKDWSSIIMIYECYLDLVRQSNKQSYGQNLLRTIVNDDILKEYDEVIFDGPFLFFRPIQEILMNQFDRQQKPVTFIVPYGSNPAFEIIKRVYSFIVPYDNWKSIEKKFIRNSTDLEQLRLALFTDKTVSNHGSLTIHSHSTLEHEIRHVIIKSKQLIDEGQATSKSIIIVTPDAMALRPLVREIAEQEHISVNIPERPLLGLLAGEFIQMIYQISVDERTFDQASYLDSSMFKKMLCSGWFSDGNQTLEHFQSVEDVFFSDTQTLDEWADQLSKLRSAKDDLNLSNFTYHPLRTVTIESLQTWIKIIEELQGLQQRLRINNVESIHKQVIDLVIELERLAYSSGFAIEESGESILARIKSISDRTKSQNRIPVNMEEFGRIIHQLFIEETEPANGDADLDQKDEVLVTGPENVAYLDYKYVFMIQFTQERFPSIPKSRWPLHHDMEWKYKSLATGLKVDSISEWEQLLAEREKFYFYLTFFVPKIEMHISFSNTSAGEKLYPSYYLYDIGMAYRLNYESVDGNTEDLVDPLTHNGLVMIHHYEAKPGTVQIHRLPESKSVIQRNLRLTIDDLAIYRLCPARYYYQNLMPDHNIYANKFQFNRYMAAVLAQRVLSCLFEELSYTSIAEDTETMSRRNHIINQDIPRLIEREKNKLAAIFPVNESMWRNAVYYADVNANNILKQIFNEKYAKATSNKGGVRLTATLKYEEKVRNLQISSSQANYEITGSRVLHSKFGTINRSYSLSHYPHLIGISSYESEEDMEFEYPDWFYEFRNEFFKDTEDTYVQQSALEMILGIENGDYKKRQGSHCSYCPFEQSCQRSSLMSLDVEQEDSVINAD